MTVSSTSRKAGPFSGNGSTTSFPFSFKIYTKNDIAVTRTDSYGNLTTLVLDSDYSVAVNANQDVSPGGTVTYPISGTALATGSTLTIGGNLAYAQTTQLPSGGAYNAQNVEAALDRLTILAQQLLEAQSRSLALPVSSSASPQLPFPSASRFLAWNEAADQLQNIDPATLATVIAYGTANADVFSGTGLQTLFNLSSNPGALNNLDVSISGVTQKPGIDYTWTSGTAVTFTSAPPAGTNNILVRYMQALPQGAFDLANTPFTQSGTGAVARSALTKMRESVSAADFGTLQQAIDSLQSGQVLVVNQDYTLSTGLTITNKSRVRITGKGKITLSGASSSAYIFQLVGTIDDLEIDNLTLVGDGNSGYAQCAIGCNSGQTVSNTSFHDLKISNINVGISHNAYLGGSWTKGLCYNNKLQNILGTVAGSGYGIHMAKASQMVVAFNTIDNASRHSIYQGAGANCNNLIIGNLILNHRSTVYDGSYRCAISCARSSAVTIVNNKFVNGYDGALEIAHETVSSTDCSNILVVGNTFVGAKNPVPYIMVGEQLVPTTNSTYKVEILNNEFDSDYAIANCTSIIIQNGNQIKVSGNRFRRYNVSGALGPGIEIGNSSYTSSSGHLSDIAVTGNDVTSDTAVAGSRFCYVSTQLCTGTSKYTIKDNILNGFANEFDFQVTPTNPNSKLKFRTSITYDVPSIAANAGWTGAFTVTGAKPTSQVCGRHQYSITSASVVFTYYAHDVNVNAIAIQVNNTTTSAYDPPSQTFIITVEDF